MSLTQGIKWPERTADGILKLAHVYDAVLFAPAGTWSDDVWARSLRTLTDARWRVLEAAIHDCVGRGGAL